MIGIEGAPIYPSMWHHVEALFELHTDMIKYFGGHFGMFITNPLVKVVIDNKAVNSIIGSKSTQMLIDDLFRE